MNPNGKTCNVLSSSFINNYASLFGGGICNFDDGILNAHFNIFYNNNAANSWGCDVYCNHLHVVNATYNWWGSNDNPGTQYKILDGYDPWLVLRIDADPSMIYNGQNSTVKANLLYDSRILTDPSNPEWYYHNPDNGHVPDGIPVTFNLIDGIYGTLGLQTPFYKGTASIIFTATAIDIQKVNATVHDQRCTALITINPIANLTITKTGPTTVIAGNTITYTITVTNNGPDPAFNVQIGDTIPAILQNIIHDSFNLGTIDPGQSKTVTITGIIPSNTVLGTIIENSATVTSDTSRTITPSDTVSTTVITHSDINITKTVNNTRPNVGGNSHIHNNSTQQWTKQCFKHPDT